MAKKEEEAQVTTWIPPQHDHGTPEPAVEVVTEQDQPSE